MSANGNILLVANWDSNVGYAWWLMENFWIEINNCFNSNCYLIYPEISAVPDAIANTSIIVSQCNLWDHSLSNLGYIRKFIKNSNIKYLYLSDSPFYSLLYPLLRLWGVRKIVVHDHTPGERHTSGPMKNLLKSLVQRIPYYTADHYISVTSYIHDRHLKVNRIPANRCCTAQNGIVPLDLDQVDKFYAQRQFDIPPERRIIVTTGRASYYKGIDFFIRVAHSLLREHRLEGYHFLFCGDGPDLKDFRTLVNELDIGDSFTFAGKRDDIRQILPSCYIGFHAALGEVGYSLSILEYMSAGLVCIVPDRPSTSQSINNMETGIVYNPNDIASATSAIQLASLTGNHELIAKNAIASVNTDYNISNTNRQLLDILKKVFN